MYNSSYDCGRGGKAALARQKFPRGIMPRFDAEDEATGCLATGCLIHAGGFSTLSPIPPPYKPMREGPSSSGLCVLPREERPSELVPLVVIFLLSFAPLPLQESQKLYLHCIPINHNPFFFCIYAAAPCSNFKFQHYVKMGVVSNPRKKNRHHKGASQGFSHTCL